MSRLISNQEEDPMIDDKFIGKTYPAVTYEVGLEKIKEYANAVGETNPVYLDEEAAIAAGYTALVAPPMFAVVYQSQLPMALLFDPEVELNLAMLVHGEQEFEFHRPVLAREVVTTEGKVIKIEHKEKIEIITLEAVSKVAEETVTTGRFTFAVRN
jgi:acyl dehydratase